MKLSRLLAISSMVVLASLSAAQLLNIGDKAPALTVSTWVKGTPQTLGNGNVTVVEFWATWCGPCKQSIPHLSELAHKYKDKVNFVGVSVFEHSSDDYTTKVPEMVKDFGDKMDYNVATEGPDSFMAKNWMTAAGENGIPAAFLVDKEGKIAWIGHPMDGLDTAIDKVLAGNNNTTVARAARAKLKSKEAEQMKIQAKLQAKVGPIVKAFQAQQYQLASDEADKVIKSDPELKPTLTQIKLMSMAQGNLKGLNKYLIGLGREPFANDAMTLNQIIWSVVEKDLKLSKSVYRSTVTLGKKMMILEPKNPMSMDTYALALWRSGNKAKALEIQKESGRSRQCRQRAPGRNGYGNEGPTEAVWRLTVRSCLVRSDLD